jgi:hypothetical protein
MAQRDGETTYTRDDAARALQQWNVALQRASAGPEADLYECATDLIAGWLSREQTFDELLNSYFHPDLDLAWFTSELCRGGPVALRTDVAMGAACALRLRQLLSRITTDNV